MPIALAISTIGKRRIILTNRRVLLFALFEFDYNFCIAERKSAIRVLLPMEMVENPVLPIKKYFLQSGGMRIAKILRGMYQILEERL